MYSVKSGRCFKEERWKDLCGRVFIKEVFLEEVMFVLDFKGCIEF